MGLKKFLETKGEKCNEPKNKVLFSKEHRRKMMENGLVKPQKQQMPRRKGRVGDMTFEKYRRELRMT